MEERRFLNIRVPRDIWLFYRRLSVEQGRSMTEIICDRLEKYKKKIENRLNSDEANV
jgi:hypothetical protein